MSHLLVLAFLAVLAFGTYPRPVNILDKAERS